MTALTPLPVPLPVFFSVLICNYNYADFVGLAIQSVLVGVSCNDIRLASASGSLVHADVLRNSGAWKQNLQQVPPLATALKDWVAPPMSACMFRRSAFLDRLFDSWEMVPPDLQNAGFWLVFQLQHHTSGVLRILETLTTCRLPDGAAASYGYLSAPSGIDATLQPPPIAETVAWLGQFYQREQALSESKPCLAAGCRPPGTSALCRGWRRSKIEDWPPDCIKAVTRHDNGVTKNNSKLSIQDVGKCHIFLFAEPGEPAGEACYFNKGFSCPATPSCHHAAGKRHRRKSRPSYFKSAYPARSPQSRSRTSPRTLKKPSSKRLQSTEISWHGLACCKWSACACG